jgi:hypothetical protein
MKYLYLTLLMLCGSMTVCAQAPTVGNNPVFFIDGVKIDRNGLSKINPDDIAMLTVLKQKTAESLYGEAGRDGVVLVETKAFVRKRYIKYLSSKSAEYAKLTADDDTNIKYIINGEVQPKDFVDALDNIADSTFVSMTVIDKTKLASDYNVTDKPYGAVISMKRGNKQSNTEKTETASKQKSGESLMLDWPDSEGWKVGDDQENEQTHVIDLVRNNETVDKWTELGNMTTIKAIKNLPIDKAMDFMFDQAKQQSPKAKLTFIEKDEQAETPWIIFTIESPGFKNDKNPESQLWYIVQGKQALYTNFRAVKQASIPDALKTKWIAFFKTGKIVYKD